MTSAVIVSPLRTAIGTARKGTLANTPPEALAKTIIQAVVERSGFAPEAIDEIVLAESLAGGGVLARHAAVQLGMMQVPGMAVNRHCAGSLSAVGVAAGAVVSGMERVTIAGGVHSSSFMPRMMQRSPETQEFADWWIPDSHPDTPEAPARDMSITVGGNAARIMGITREEMDAWAVRSHQRAVAAIDAGNFAGEIVPITVRGPDGQEFEFRIDEHPRRGTTMEKLADLKILHPEIEGFGITAGNSSGVNDGAAAMVVASEEAARDAGAEVAARIVGWTSKAVEPVRNGLSVSGVVEKLLANAGRKVTDIKLWEINEAFASVPVAACRILGLDEETVNVSGSGCSIGHPIAASGARMITTLINDLKRRGGGLGVATMCAGGGMGGAVLIEV